VARHPGGPGPVRTVTWYELAERAGRLALGARSQAREVEARRVALSRYALVWWQGEAAESYRRRVHDRANGLAELAVALQALAREADALAARARGRAEAEAVEWLTGGPR
jgi:uncharacterized protein YukE